MFSPDAYVQLMDEINDARLLAIATERMAHYDPSTVISGDKINRHLDIKEEDLTDYDEVELE